MSSGYVYVMGSPFLAGMVKIGKALDVEQRCKRLRTGCPGLAVLAHRHYDDMDAVEAALHDHFEVVRVPDSEEWFWASVDEVLAVMPQELGVPAQRRAARRHEEIAAYLVENPTMSSRAVARALAVDAHAVNNVRRAVGVSVTPCSVFPVAKVDLVVAAIEANPFATRAQLREATGAANSTVRDAWRKVRARAS